MPQCENCKFYHICKGRLNETVSECVRYKSVEQTNEEWLRNASTEELAEWIVHLADVCTMHHECNVCAFNWCDEKKVMEWLKQPHTLKE